MSLRSPERTVRAKHAIPTGWGGGRKEKQQKKSNLRLFIAWRKAVELKRCFSLRGVVISQDGAPGGRRSHAPQMGGGGARRGDVKIATERTGRARGRRAAIRRLPPAAIGCHFPAGAPQLEHVLPQPPHRPPFPPGPPPPHAAMELPWPSWLRSRRRGGGGGGLSRARRSAADAWSAVRAGLGPRRGGAAACRPRRRWRPPRRRAALAAASGAGGCSGCAQSHALGAAPCLRCLLPHSHSRRSPAEGPWGGGRGEGGAKGGDAGGAEPRRGGAAGAVRAARAAPRREGRPLPPAAASGEWRGPGGRLGRAPARSYCHSQRAPAMALARTHTHTHIHSFAHSQPSVLPPPPARGPPSAPAHPSAAAGTRRLIGARRCRRDSRERKGSAAGGGAGGGGDGSSSAWWRGPSRPSLGRAGARHIGWGKYPEVYEVNPPIPEVKANIPEVKPRSPEVKRRTGPCAGLGAPSRGCGRDGPTAASRAVPSDGRSLSARRALWAPRTASRPRGSPARPALSPFLKCIHRCGSQRDGWVQVASRTVGVLFKFVHSRGLISFRTQAVVFTWLLCLKMLFSMAFVFLVGKKKWILGAAVLGWYCQRPLMHVKGSLRWLCLLFIWVLSA